MANMAKEFSRPRVFSSRCLGFAACRWNGVTIPDAFVDKLKPYVDFVAVCPEVEVGLGVPRDPIRIVRQNNSLRLMQLNTGRDITDAMNGFAGRYLDSLGAVDGFIMKDRSPSCGLKDVKVYLRLEKSNVVMKTSGFFATGVLHRHPELVVETEARLTNFSIREHFLARLFTVARFRAIKENRAMKDLVQFHAENKFLLKTYSQKELGVMGRIAANQNKKKPEAVFADYETHLHAALKKPSKYTANINVMTHALGYFSKEISPEERKFFLNSLEEYRREQVPLSVPVNLLRSFVIRFKIDYLSQQTYFEPYPFTLTEVTDSGKGRLLK